MPRRVAGCFLTFRSKVSPYCPTFQQSKQKIGQMRSPESRGTTTNKRTTERCLLTRPATPHIPVRHLSFQHWLVCSPNVNKTDVCRNKMNTVCFACTLRTKQRQKTVVLTRKQSQIFHVRSLSHAYNWTYQKCAYWRGKTGLRYYTVLTPPPPPPPHQPVITLVTHVGLSWKFDEWWPRELVGWSDIWRFETCKDTPYVRFCRLYNSP